MGKIIRRILTIIPAVALQSLWLLLLMKWLTPYAPIIVSLLSVAAFFLVVFIIIKRDGSISSFNFSNVRELKKKGIPCIPWLVFR